MNSRRLLLLIFVGTTLLTVSCSRMRKGVTDSAEPDSTIVESADNSDEVEVWADSVLSSMSLRNKVAQLFLPSLFASDDYWTLKAVREYAGEGIGGIMLLKGTSADASRLADSLQKWSRVPAFVAIDAEWGLAMRLKDAPRFPVNSAIRKDADDQTMYDYGRELARECRMLGINMVLGPVVDVDAGGGYMKKRSFGSDPRRVADLALSYARGLDDGNVASVAKHFPGHGSVMTDSHKRAGIIRRNFEALDSIDLYPFRKWAEQRLPAVMVGHLSLFILEGDSRPASFSKVVIRDLLQQYIGFGGLVLTDAVSMGGAEGYTSADAIAAGADIIVAPENTNREIERIVACVEEGELSETEIDERVRKILRYKYRYVSGESAKEPESLSSSTADSISARLSR